MVTQLVMIFTIFFLIFSGVNFWKRGVGPNKKSVKIFSIGLFFIAFAILTYSIRDIFTQLRLYGAQEIFLIIGGLIHILGGYFILWFVIKEFVENKHFRIAFYVLFFIALFSIALFLSGKIFKIESEIKQAPFDYPNYVVIRNYVADPAGITILYSIIILISFLILGVILLNSLKTKNKKIKTKGLLYGLGCWFLISPMLICALISPVYARIGYLIGSILLWKTFNIKV